MRKIQRILQHLRKSKYDTIRIAQVTERFLLFFVVYVTFQAANRQENKRKEKQNEEKWKEAINFRNCVTCNVCNLDMVSTMCGCATGRAKRHRDWICNI